MNGTFFCNKCGAQNTAGAQFCNRCGTPTSPASGTVPTAVSSSSSPGLASSPAAPYSASTPSYPGFTPAVGVRYAGFWIRVVAAIIDAIILRVVVAPIHLIFGGLGLAGMMAGVPHVPLAIFGGGLTFIVLVFGSWLYEAFMESSSYQATLGKMIFGLKVTDLNGNRISFERATGRHFAKWLSA
ncbi:MAG: RDD family protein, partial [Terriglobales bacterium]